MKAITSGGGGGGTVSIAGKKRKIYSAAKTVTRAPRMRMFTSVKPNGDYKLTRCTNCVLPFNGSGFNIALANYSAVGIIFEPGGATVVTTTLGGNIPATIPNYAEIAALWDRIRIDKVVIEMSANRTDPLIGASTGSNPIIYYAYDNTDVLANTLAITQQQANCRSWHPSANLPDCVTVVYPSYQRIVYYTPTLSSYEPARGFVVSDTGIPHYALRLAADFGTSALGALNLRFTFHYTCRGVK